MYSQENGSLLLLRQVTLRTKTRVIFHLFQTLPVQFREQMPQIVARPGHAVYTMTCIMGAYVSSALSLAPRFMHLICIVPNLWALISSVAPVSNGIFAPEQPYPPGGGREMWYTYNGITRRER